MKIQINHLNYTIFVKDISKSEYNDMFDMCVVKEDDNSCTLYKPNKIKKHDIPTLAHEVLHCLQFISEARSIDLVQEEENMGYMMQYILNELLGFSYC